MEDVAEEKASKYGHSFLSLIKDFCQEKNWKMDIVPEEVQISTTASVGQSIDWLVYELYCYCILLYLYIYLALHVVHTDEKRFQCERPREKRAVLREQKETLGSSPVNKE